MTPDRAGQVWLDALPDATVGLDEHGVLEWANEAAVRLFGWSAEDYVGRQVFELVHPADLDFVVLSFASVQAKEVGTYIEVRVKTATGWKLLEVIGANRLGQADLDCLPRSPGGGIPPS